MPGYIKNRFENTYDEDDNGHQYSTTCFSCGAPGLSNQGCTSVYASSSNKELASSWRLESDNSVYQRNPLWFCSNYCLHRSK